MSYWRMPLDAVRREIVLGKVNIISHRCKGCRYCIEFCPSNTLAESEDFNEKGYHPPYVKSDAKCVNCNYCETICPEFAIFVTELEPRNLLPEDVVKTQSRSRRRTRRE
ncbi:MAG TPA: 4Fe-4S dicluster domain-containing protein [bacterium]|nr:4Fe-4S dicluster domain-containing protein [bacterium]